MILWIKHMVSNRCKILVKDELSKLHLHFIIVDLGEIEIMENITEEQRDQLRKVLLRSGLELMDDKKAILIEKIKNIIIDIVHYSEEPIKIKFSTYLSEKLNYSYTYLANLFSEAHGITIIQFMISHKIERVKEFIIYDELTLTEIAKKMNYSSVGHLSNQFKKNTGLSPTQFKQINYKRIAIEEIN